MDREIITSRHNSLVKHARAVRDGRESQGQIFIEGLRLAEEAVRARLVIQDVLYTEKFQHEERGARLLYELKAEGSRFSLLSEEALASISDTRTPQGIIMLASRPHAGRETLLAGSKRQSSKSGRAGHVEIDFPLVVIIHGINNPANAGAILRTAEAAGATGVVSTKGTTDLFSPKALRGAMGSSFRLSLWTGADFAEVINWCRENGIRTLGAALGATKTHTDADWTTPCALVIGSEAA
ncbi:MAG TPA: RNA methyltransferase, partial [Pyrinomonadaceae bacterium]|nr:RNA methyltransferase [Pyrinomonadaceae bacterium]